MTEGQIFLAVLVALYLTDCCLWSRRQSVVFFSKWKRRWKMKRGDEGFDNDRGGILFAWPFPPLGTVFKSEPSPVAVTEEGVGTTTAESPNPGPRCIQPERSFTWNEITRIQRDERKIYLNEEKFLKCSGGDEAARLSSMLKRVSDTKREERSERIAFEFRQTLRTERVRKLRELFFKATGGLRFHCNVLFITGFVIVPLAYWTWRAKPPFFMTLLFVWILMVFVAGEAFALHRKFYPRLRGERWQHFFIQLFVPQHAMRAVDSLSRHFLQRFHPLAVARVLLDEERFEDFAGSVVRDLRNPLPFHAVDPHPSHDLAIAFKDRFVRPAVEEFVVSEGIPIEHLTGAPEHPEEDAVAYCPRCMGTYILKDASCRDCGDMKTVPVA